jgi:3-phenylpropionate/cinnamic acid dioxygenase small subunit
MSNTWIRVQDALGRWAWGYDEADLDMFVNSVTTEARVTIETAGGEQEVLDGREAIRAFFGSRLRERPPGLPRRHVTTPVLIDTGDRDATVLSYLTLYTFNDGVPQLVSTGWYRDHVVNEGDAWRIASRHVHLDVAEVPKPY